MQCETEGGANAVNRRLGLVVVQEPRQLDSLTDQFGLLGFLIVLCEDPSEAGVPQHVHDDICNERNKERNR